MVSDTEVESSLVSIKQTLLSIKDSMEHLQDVVSDMAEMLESSYPSTHQELTT